MKVLCVIGTRPEAIKLAPVVGALRRASAVVSVCVTGQHRDMLDQTLAVFQIKPDHDLDVMQPGQSLTDISTRVLRGLEPVMLREPPDWVLVQGDTTTAFIAGLAACYQRVRVAHVEAGLRTHDKWKPYPEEINRKLVDAIADLHFAPTEEARNNLLREGAEPSRVVLTGNTVIDALQSVGAMPPPPAVAPLLDSGRRLVLVTAHRRESFGEPLERICYALSDLATRYPDDVRIVYPVHSNPMVEGPVRRLLGDHPHVHLTPPVDYLALVHLMKRAYLILTDSGGIQEEAPHLGVPVLVLREVTERPEAVALGAARVVGTSRERIVAEASRLLDHTAERAAMSVAVSPYGDGRASERIVSALVDYRTPRPAASR
jgi:UDP-N-acetylglucosamine 2-epimerase